MDTKKWYRSKTLWVNLIALAAIIAQLVTGDEWFPAEYQAVAIAFINMLVRLLTGKPIEMKLK